MVKIRLAQAAVLAMVIGAVGGAKTVQESGETEHRSSLTGKLTMRNGQSRIVELEGVGCRSSLCSRVAVNSRNPGDANLSSTWLDSISAIRDVTKDDALFLFRDGTERRLSVVPLNRVLYVKGGWLGGEKIGLEKIRSLEF